VGKKTAVDEWGENPDFTISSLIPAVSLMSPERGSPVMDAFVMATTPPPKIKQEILKARKETTQKKFKQMGMPRSLETIGRVGKRPMPTNAVIQYPLEYAQPDLLNPGRRSNPNFFFSAFSFCPFPFPRLVAAATYELSRSSLEEECCSKKKKRSKGRGGR
jgi:hypothetical protein